MQSVLLPAREAQGVAFQTDFTVLGLVYSVSSAPRVRHHRYYGLPGAAGAALL